MEQSAKGGRASVWAPGWQLLGYQVLEKARKKQQQEVKGKVESGEITQRQMLLF